MKKFWRLLFPFILVVVLSMTFADHAWAKQKYFQDTSRLYKFSHNVAELFYNNQIAKALDLLSPHWAIPQAEKTNFEEKTIHYLDMISQRFGNPLGFQKIKEEQIGDFALRETYLVLYEYSAIRLIFTFYKNQKGWFVNTFAWDDSFDKEFMPKK